MEGRIWRMGSKLGLIFTALIATSAALADQLTRPATPLLLGDWLGTRIYLFE
jgi:hypothetical protein